MRAWVPGALVVQVAASRRRQAAHVIIVVMVIERMDGMSANDGCGWRRGDGGHKQNRTFNTRTNNEDGHTQTHILNSW